MVPIYHGENERGRKMSTAYGGSNAGPVRGRTGRRRPPGARRPCSDGWSTVLPASSVVVDRPEDFPGHPLLHLPVGDGTEVPGVHPHVQGGGVRIVGEGAVRMAVEVVAPEMGLVPDPHGVVAEDELPRPALRVRILHLDLRQVLRPTEEREEPRLPP